MKTYNLKYEKGDKVFCILPTNDTNKILKIITGKVNKIMITDEVTYQIMPYSKPGYFYDITEDNVFKNHNNLLDRLKEIFLTMETEVENQHQDGYETDLVDKLVTKIKPTTGFKCW